MTSMALAILFMTGFKVFPVMVTSPCPACKTVGQGCIYLTGKKLTPPLTTMTERAYRMPCYRPRDCYELTNQRTENGKKVLVFSHDQASGQVYKRMQVPCQSCVGCLLDRSRDWAIRSVHEAHYHENNCFITLTFNPECINPKGTLVKDDWSNFMKRLRKRFVPGKRQLKKQKGKLEGAQTSYIRYFHCGEYGTRGDRPHHHACLFNFRPTDLTLWTIREGVRLYRSEELEEVWSQQIEAKDFRFYDESTVFERHGKYYAKLGYITIGDVTWESAAYCARYILKKTKTENDYERVDEETGEIYRVIPDYCSASNRPGLGNKWCREFWSDFYPKNYMQFDGRRIKPPKYYDRIMDKIQPSVIDRVRKERQKRAKELSLQDPIELLNKEAIKIQAIAKLERIYDDL